MFLKIAGAFFLITGGALAGGSKAYELSERTRILRGFTEAIGAFKNEINYITADMETALKSAAERDRSGVFGKCLESFFENGASVALRNSALNSGLNCEEKEILLSFAKGLSGQDKQSQIENAAMAVERFKKLLEKSEEKKEKLSSLYCTVGFLGGALGSILLL